MTIHPDVQLGPVHYTVGDLQGQIDFYRTVLGFEMISQENGTAVLGTSQRPLLKLTEVKGAKRIRGVTGLYHTAFLVPTRWDLAHHVRQVAESGARFQGASNHGTHLAFYLADLEGNGIEIAWDFPQDQWPMIDGKLDLARMRQGIIDMDALWKEMRDDPSPWKGVHADTIVGHVHLHAADLAKCRAFYHDLLGFDVMIDSQEFGALFVSAGGYHHHLGFNTWRGPNLSAPPDDALGLRYFTVVVPNEDEMGRLEERLRDAGHAPAPYEDGLMVKDPSGLGMLLHVG